MLLLLSLKAGEIKLATCVFKFVIIFVKCRETEWLFSTKEGRKKLLKSANFNRLAIITMHRNQKYDSLETVKEELKTIVLNLAPVNTGKVVNYIIIYILKVAY